ncbi:MAG: hypothetical protein LBJ08_09040 [Bifidobacteriaceae bacterium]|jgi:hypothetical protein|nr:hypothetical protein [Bifidobacteriaceae bacterium]
MRWFHSEEENELGALMAYKEAHYGARYLVEFLDGESYICTYATAYESENGGELDIEEDHPLYDEFWEIAMDIEQTVKNGLRRYGDSLALTYRDFPALIKDWDTGAVVFSADAPPA